MTIVIFFFLTKQKNSNHSNSELELTNTAEKKLSEITIRLSCKVSWGRRKNLLLKNGVYGWPRNNKRAKIMNTRKSFKSLLETCASLHKKKKSLHHFFFILFKTKTFFLLFPAVKKQILKWVLLMVLANAYAFRAIAFFVQDKQPTRLSCR